MPCSPSLGAGFRPGLFSCRLEHVPDARLPQVVHRAAGPDPVIAQHHSTSRLRPLLQGWFHRLTHAEMRKEPRDGPDEELSRLETKVTIAGGSTIPQSTVIQGQGEVNLV